MQLRKAFCLKILALAGALAVGLPAFSGSAEAQSRSAAFVMDAKTGKVLFQENADAARYPASLTKIMTLYVLFEELERGNLKLSTPLRVSATAAAQPPSKIGVRPGETIQVEDAIKALVTKSANDVAVVIAENIEGTVSAFASRMTRTARALGMSNTTFRNPHGLPDSRQRTTARDLATLSLAIQQHFPREFRYFTTRSFTWRGRRHGNHNKLLGRVPGVNGIKTGFIRASGFNLSTNVERDGRHVVAIVMGGSTGAARDARMRGLIEKYIGNASRGRQSAPLIARPNGAGGGVRVASSSGAPSGRVPMPIPAPQAAQVVAAATSTAPAEPMAILPEPRPVVMAASMTGSVTAAPEERAPAAAAPAAKGGTAQGQSPSDIVRNIHSKFTPAAITASASPSTPSSDALALTTTTPPAMRWVTGAQPVQTAAAPVPNDDAQQKMTALVEQEAAPAVQEAPLQLAAVAPVAPQAQTSAQQAEAETMAVVREGWLIQIGATEDVGGAETLLERARNRAGGVLANAEPFTEPVTKGEQTLYRARFAGFDDQRTAQAACQTLKRQSMACFATRSN